MDMQNRGKILKLTLWPCEIDFSTTPSHNPFTLSGSEMVFLSPDSSVVLLSFPRMDRTVLVPGTVFKEINANHFAVSGDKRHVVLAHDIYKRYRHSFWAKYTIYEVATG